MAASKYAQHVKHNRRQKPGTLTRDEYLVRARELAPRGQDLPQSKLLDLDVIDIRSAHRQRLALLQYIRDNLSNEALAKRHGVSKRNIERIVSAEAWSHLA